MMYFGCLTHTGHIDPQTLEQRIHHTLKKSNETWWIAAVRERVRLHRDIPYGDGLDGVSFKHQIELIRQHAINVGQDFKKINLIVNETVNPADIDCEFNVFSIDIFRAIVFYYLQHTDQKFNSSYSPSNRQALFLMGKPNKKHRTPLLIDLVNRGLSPNLIYSWYPSEPGNELFDHTHKIVKETGFDDINLEDFFHKHTNILDVPKFGLTNAEKTRDGFHYSGFPFDHKHYEQTSVSIVSETDTDNCPTVSAWITEKTWRAIANHHPFILAASSSTSRNLSNRGYETWDSYLLYDQPSANKYWTDNPKKSIKMIGDNVNFFIKNSQYDTDSISRLAEKNFNLMIEHAKQDIVTAFPDENTFKRFIEHVKFTNWHWKDNL